jgi:hypothetical protein
VVTENETGATQNCIFTGGYSNGRAYGTVPAFTYLDVEIQLPGTGGA